jgi:hypothetical protein
VPGFGSQPRGRQRLDTPPFPGRGWGDYRTRFEKRKKKNPTEKTSFSQTKTKTVNKKWSLSFQSGRYQARCRCESELGNRATFRLRQLVAGGGLDLERAACACRTGTEGTMGCNYGRSCAVLRARGQDVGATLIAEGLAHVYVCGRTSCPARGSWCAVKLCNRWPPVSARRRWCGACGSGARVSRGLKKSAPLAGAARTT